AELKALRGLTPPPDDRAAVKRMLDGLDQSIAVARDLVAAADAGDTAKVSAAATALQTQLADTTRQAKPFGLALCPSGGCRSRPIRWTTRARSPGCWGRPTRSHAPRARSWSRPARSWSTRSTVRGSTGCWPRCRR